MEKVTPDTETGHSRRSFLADFLSMTMSNPMIDTQPAFAPDLPMRAIPKFGPETIRPGSFAYTSPYGGVWMEHFYSKQAEDLFGGKVVKESDFRKKLAAGVLPELMIMGNFVVERAGIVALCRELGINTVHSEDGFFPHYSTMHADPLGFCWESSLTTQVFRRSSPRQRAQAQQVRAAWLDFSPQELPASVRKPFVLWPLQLIGDRVNRWDLNVEEWVGLLQHFRQCLPKNIQFVVKEHPRAKALDEAGTKVLIEKLPNTVLLPKEVSLKTLLRECSAVAGANSTVLYEARLMFHKPVYAYARGWFTNHYELFTPVHRAFEPRPLNLFDSVVDNRLLHTERLDDYTDWFLAQLLARQITHVEAQDHPEQYRQKMLKLSYASYLAHGEDIFA